MKNRMKELRTNKKLSMRDASSQLGLPLTTYCNYENGKRDPDSETLILLADFFGVSIDYMIGRGDEKEVKRQEAITKTEAELLRLFRSMSKEQRDLIIATARQIKK